LVVFFASIIILLQIYQSIASNTFSGLVLHAIPAMIVYLAAFIGMRRHSPAILPIIGIGLAYLLIIKSQLSDLGFWVLCSPSVLLIVLLFGSLLLRRFRS